jgi:small GTP-binding protein
MAVSRPKVIFTGSLSVGKTTLLARITTNEFSGMTEPTTACAYSAFSPPGHPEVSIQFWDTSGMERFRSINKVYYREAVAAVLVFSLADQHSFDELNMWLGDFKTETTVTNPAIFLTGNKCDLTDSLVVEEEAIRTWADERGFEYFVVSAYTGEGVAELLDAIVRFVPKGNALANTTPVNVQIDQPAAAEGSGCC